MNHGTAHSPLDHRTWISKHRNEIMGLMALLIIVYHARWTTGVPLYDNTINRYGSIGVDVFVFVSGFGLAYSLTKTPDVGAFMRKRLARILPAYYAFEGINLLVVLLLMALGIQNHLMQPIESILPVGAWFNFDSNRNLAYKWYISATLGFYVMSIFIYPVLRKSKYLYLNAFLFLLVTVAFIPYIADMSHMPFALQRIPALVVGLTVGVASLRREAQYRNGMTGQIFLALLCLLGILMIALEGQLPGKYLQKMTDASHLSLKQALIAPLFTVLLAAVLELFEKFRLADLVKCLDWLGKLSLELYLIHSILSGVLDLTSLPKAAQVLLTVLLSIPAALLLKYIAAQLLRIWRKVSVHFVTNDSDPLLPAQPSEKSVYGAGEKGS